MAVMFTPRAVAWPSGRCRRHRPSARSRVASRSRLRGLAAANRVMAARRGTINAPTGPAQGSSLCIGDLPDDLLVLCLEPLCSRDRHGCVALVSRRFRQLCRLPQLLRSIAASAPGKSGHSRRRLQSLQNFLLSHAHHVRELELGIYCDGLTQQEESEAAALAGASLAVGGLASLDTLRIESDVALSSYDWLGAMGSLRQLTVCTPLCELRLPASASRLTALESAYLVGIPIEFQGAPPPALTKLTLRDNDCMRLPKQLTSLRQLAVLELYCPDLGAGGVYPLATLPALRALRWDSTERLPRSVADLTQLRSLAVLSIESAEAEAACEAALRALQGLTAVLLEYADHYVPARLLPSVDGLPDLQLLGISARLSYAQGEAETRLLPPANLRWPWLASLRWVALPHAALRGNARTLRLATQLERVDSVGPPAYGRLSVMTTSFGDVKNLLRRLPAVRTFTAEVLTGDLGNLRGQRSAVARLRREQRKVRCRTVEPGTCMREMLQRLGLPDGADLTI